MIKLLWKIR